MTTVTDFAPIMGTIGGGFLGGMLAGYAIKKVIRFAAVIIGLFIAALAYLEYQRIINVDWVRVQSVSQSGIAWAADVITHISNNIDAPHSATSNLGLSTIIPLTSSVSAGLFLVYRGDKFEFSETGRTTEKVAGAWAV
jgi:uncharacterized membrane protein (Fun14 family)